MNINSIKYSCQYCLLPAHNEHPSFNTFLESKIYIGAEGGAND
ncbi:uncharacterized protein METZ01_LOCUS498245 [marine metagenome]|uniref:Uncharacterized protein n=1 Tax=marine metagenome TaxID=408172 RepID=A0A383DLQ1_9ZZZZ